MLSLRDLENEVYHLKGQIKRIETDVRGHAQISPDSLWLATIEALFEGGKDLEGRFFDLKSAPEDAAWEEKRFQLIELWHDLSVATLETRLKLERAAQRVNAPEATEPRSNRRTKIGALAN